MSDEREKFYDDEIAPALLDLAQRCHDRGISFVASVEWGATEGGSTVLLTEQHGFGIEITAVAARANNNADTIIFRMMRYAEQHGHGSICLDRLGVPSTPAPA